MAYWAGCIWAINDVIFMRAADSVSSAAFCVGKNKFSKQRARCSLLLANILQALYSMVDMLFVGRMVGENGLAAVSNASMMSFVLNAICLGMTTGGTVMMAQYQGAEDKDGQGKTLAAFFYLTLIVAALITMGALMIYNCFGAGYFSAAGAVQRAFGRGFYPMPAELSIGL